MFKEYRLGLDKLGVVICFSLMLPHIFWSVSPEARTIFHQTAQSSMLDSGIMIVQVMMIATTCFILRKKAQPSKEEQFLTALTLVFSLVYYLGWTFYRLFYFRTIIVLMLTIVLCVAFLAYQASKRNWVAVSLTLLSLSLHLIQSILAFM